MNSEDKTGEANSGRTGLDPRVRQEPADHTAAPSRLAKVLRDAIDWREVFQRRESSKHPQ